jgi:GNAT superfamily N-acetyltransferase
MAARFAIEALAAHHDRTAFRSGALPLDRYFHSQVTQDARKRATSCYVALELTASRIAGYYTLAAAHVALHHLPEAVAKRLPRYPAVPVARLGRLAVDETYRGQKLGAALLWDAAMRAARSELAVFALYVDAKDEQAEAFYNHHGFIALGSPGKQLLLPLATFAAQLER